MSGRGAFQVKIQREAPGKWRWVVWSGVLSYLFGAKEVVHGRIGK